MGGKHSKDKGRRNENAIVGYLRAHGYPDTERISVLGLPGPDITGFNGRVIEAKIEATPPSKKIEDWLKDVAMVIYRFDDEMDYRVVMRLDELLDLLDEADNGELWE